MLKKERGFTLIELLVTLAVIFILFSLSNYNLNFWITNSRLKSDFRELYLTFLQARQYAIIHQEDYGLRFEENEQKYILFSASNGEIESRQFQSGTKYLADGISFGKSNSMTFKAIGTAQGGNVVISNGTNKAYKIIVYGHTGRVRYEKIDLE